MASSETVIQDSISVVRMEGVSLLASNSGTTALNADTSTTQFITIPVLPDVLSGIDQQNLIFARSIDGNTVLLDASQLALLTDQTIPVYDGTNLFQVTSESSIETSVMTKSADISVPAETVEIVQDENNVDISIQPNQNEEEILPPDRGPHKCNICGQEFTQLKLYHRHVKLHAEDKPHRCTECEASFNKKNNLLLHQATHNTSDPVCPVCKRKFARMASLKAHLMLHEVDDNLSCSLCGDEFSTQFKFDKHIQDHMNEATDRTFTCRTCLKSFKKLSHLKEHSKMHYKIKASLHRRIYKKNIDRSSFSHKCYFCGKLFQKPSQLIRHNRIHTGERPFKCETCGKAFNQKGALLIHRVKHTGERPHTCEFCPASFAQKGNLRNHIRRVHTLMSVEGSESVHQCELCTCVFRKLGSLNAHMSRAHASANISMSTLKNLSGTEVNAEEIRKDTSLRVINELIALSKNSEAPKISEESLKNVVSDGTVNADILQQALENSGLATEQQQDADRSKPCIMTLADSATGTLKTHIMRNVGGVRWYQCVYCVKEFKKPSDLVRHIRIHTHEKPYKCDQCYRAFAVKSTLNAHIRTHSGTKEFSCDYCKKLFSTSGSLKVHLLLHTGAKPFSCSICDKKFRTNGHRNSHMNSHSVDKSLKRIKRTNKVSSVSDINVNSISLQEPILITDTGYMQQTSKNTYQQILESAYPSIRPYRCSVCQKGFKKSSHLKQHVRSHTGEKPYECNECHRAFVSNGVLKSHLKTHTGVRAFTCDICDASFTTNGSLKRHMCIHRDDRPYMCPYCQKTFKTSMNCKKHMKTHRYELALGLASAVAVAVVPEPVHSILNSGNQKDIQNTAQVIEQIENVEVQTAESSNVQPVLTFTTDPEQGIAGTETLSQISHLQETFNAETGIIEQAEIVTQVSSFDSTQGNIFTLTSSDFAENHLTLQLESNEDNILHDTTTENDPLVSSVSNTVSQVKPTSDTDVRNGQNDSYNSERKDPLKRKRYKKPYKCLQCSKIFKKSSYLKQHIRQHTGERPYRCNICGHFYTTKRILLDHMKTHESNSDIHYPCEKCTAVLSSKKALIRHMVVHDSDQPFHCSYCTARFSTRELYKEHLTLYHQDTTPAPQVIEVINGENRIFSYANKPESVTEQTITNEAQRSVIESVTNKQDKSEYLPKHPHVCTHCPKSFKKPSDLVRHLRIHTGEKPYACETCGKAFTVKSTLDSHIKTHTGERNFICHVCGSLFATKGSLKVHLRLHTGSRPFKCPHCELTFRTSGHRKSHMVSHFKDKSRSKRKTFVIEETIRTENEPEEQPPPTNSVEVINLQTEPCPEIQVPVSHEDIQLQLPTLVGQNIQITALDPSFLSQPIQIDAALLQKLQQNFNISITLTPAVPDQMNKLVDINQAQPVLNIEANPSTVPATSGTLTVNPMMIQHLGYTVPQQSETQVTDTVPLSIADLNLTKNGSTEIFQANEILDSQVLTLDTNIGTEVILDSSNKTSADILTNEGNCNNYTSAEAKDGTSASFSAAAKDGTSASFSAEAKDGTSASFSAEAKDRTPASLFCSVCLKSFKTSGQLNAHEAIHKTATKYIYHCEMCNKSFKKKNLFFKHMQIHSS